MENLMQKSIEEIADKRAEYIEKYAAAFLKEVGSEKASQYQLVERQYPGQLTITWSFEKLTTPSPNEFLSEDSRK